jgi:diamine N-acetyltransferase
VRGEVSIRRAGALDAALLAELGARTFRDTFAADNTPEDMAAYIAANFTAEKIGAELADEAIRFLIADVDGTTAGYAMLHRGDVPAGVVAERPVELRRIYVDSDWLGRGVGQALMDRSLEEARDSGADVVWLGVWERNGRAIAFYLKSGFSKVGEHDFMLGSDRQTDWVMARRL